MTERTFVMIKPDAVARGLSGEILARFERRGFAVQGLKKCVMARDAAEEHYAEHRDKPFFAELVEFITSGPVVMMCIEGEGAIMACRTMMGATNPQDAAPGTIRGDYALEVGQNVIHGSDGPESATRELGIHFSESEIIG
ncbi:MAG: nucleoside-diphosphate kinase [Acidobacteria bacterium]|nr:nucleoside-diphosphate kinase [Acidobacteriota bacterium]